MAEIGVIGSGSWGTALALVLNKNGHHVTIWSYLKEEADEIREKRENPSKLPGVHIPEEIEITTDLQGSVEGKDVVVLAVPSMATRATAKKMCPYVKEEQILVNVAKGIEEGTLKTLSEQIDIVLVASHFHFLIDFRSDGAASIRLNAKPPLRASLTDIFVLFVTIPFFI